MNEAYFYVNTSNRIIKRHSYNSLLGSKHYISSLLWFDEWQTTDSTECQINSILGKNGRDDNKHSHKIET